MHEVEKGNRLKSRIMGKLFMKASIVNALVAILWTVMIISPIKPFSLLLRIIVAGGPGTWFLLAYILYIIIGSGAFIGFSYLYYLIEEVWRIETSDRLKTIGFYLFFIGPNLSLIVLAVAGAVGGYYLNIIHAPVETVRSILEPFINPLRILSLATVVGAIVCLTPVIVTFLRS